MRRRVLENIAASQRARPTEGFARYTVLEQVAEIRSRIPISHKKNVGFADIDLEGVIDGEFSRVSGRLIAESGDFSHAGTVGPAISASRRFTTRATSRNSRNTRAWDSEVKILEYIAARISPRTRGTIDLVSERVICDSCSNPDPLGVIEQFRAAFPNIELRARHGGR